MNKSSFRLAFMAVLAGSLSGCASPMKLFAKKPQSYDDYRAQYKAEQTQIAGSHATPGGPAEVSELLHQGHAAFQQGNLAEAQSKYFAVVQRQPNHPVANHRLGVIADRQQDYMTAQRHYFAALNASPNDPNLLNDIGYSFLLQSRYADAENYLQAALQKNPKQSNAINNLGLLYAKQGQPDRALAMFRMTNSDAEARAKVTRLMPNTLSPAAPQPGTMLANQGWPPQSPATMNATPYNSFNAANNPAAHTSNGQALANSVAADNAAAATNQLPIHQPQFPPTTIPNGGWAPPSQATPSGSEGISHAAAIMDPNLPEETRRIREQMESIRLKAVSERQMRDNAERHRQEMLKRQLRDEELGRANIVNPVYTQPTGANRWNGSPGSGPSNPNAPIVIGPPPNANVPNSAPWQATPDGQRPTNGAFGQFPNGQSNAMPNVAPHSMPEPISNHLPNPMTEPRPNAQRGSVPPTGLGSPLDSMPTWPPAGSLPAVTPNNSGTGPNPPPPIQGGSAWPNGFGPNGADDPARAASRLGMNAGSSNPFPITPGPSSGMPNSPAPFNNFGPPNGMSPTTPPNWPSNLNQPHEGALPGEPPAGSFGPSNFNTSANSQNQLPESPTQFALQDRLPQSEQFQTPTAFGQLPAGPTQTLPASFGTSRGSSGLLPPQLGSRNNAPVSRMGEDERWENGLGPGTQSAQTSTPIMQGYLTMPANDHSLMEYERMIQATNAETNQIRQLIDAQRQLPPSENFRRSGQPPNNGTPSGFNARQ